MSDFYNALIELGVDSKSAEDVNLDFNTILGNLCNPSEYWECAGTGSYKECYFVDKVAVKFALECNATMSKEGRIYYAAADADLSSIFAHTIFLPLEVRLPAYFIGEEEDEVFDCVVLQEKVDKILGNCEDIHAILWYNQNESYDKNPLFYNGVIIPYKDVDQLVQIFCYQEWIQAGIDFYGMDFMQRLADFCEDMQIYDLHAYNLGFRADGSPVIFDFLS